ncbi:hypothetical protein [Carbonactinospora thermoautotrophica]|uniref:hypothetical protein n=1 Tax=Carbonactinospora thermoautotrophica TaxID=1469144 RepID=UPI001E5A12FD|nr:hypothetical protein [Carbonactinospora thermoautotrophica]
MRDPAQFDRADQVLRGVVQAGYERPPVQDRPVPTGQLGGEPQRLLRDLFGERLDALVVDAGIGEQQRHPQVAQRVQPHTVLGVHPIAGDHQHMVAQAALVQVLQHREQVVFDLWQERVGGAVEDLQRCDVRLEVPVVHQQLNRLSIGHQRPGLAHVPRAVDVADAVRAVQRTTHHMIQRQPRLAVLHHLLRALR